jgi:type IV pilus assembly protein PilC
MSIGQLVVEFWRLAMSQIAMRTLSQLIRRVGASSRAGLDARSIWDQEARYGSLTHRHQLSRVSRRLAEGDSLADALSDCDGYFPALVCDMAEIGEQTGKLDEVLLGLADHYDHLLSLRRSFLLGIAWPSLQLAAAVLIVGFLIWFMGMINPDITILGLSGTSGLFLYVLFIGLIAAAVVLLIAGTSRGWFGLGPIQLAMRLPLLGNCLKTMALARLAWSLGMALDAGVDARKAMSLALRSTQSPYYTTHLEAVDRSLLEGNEFNVALAQTGSFPDDFIQTLANAEIAGTCGDAMSRLAGEYRDRAQAASRTLTMIASFLIWGAVAVIFLVLIFQIFTTVILQPYRDALDFLEESQ